MNGSFFAFMAEKEVEYKRDHLIKDFSSVRIGGTAFVLAFPDTEEKLISLIRYLNGNNIKYKVVGKMTNILASDEGYDGVIVFTLKLTHYSFDGCAVCAECGALFSLVIARAAQHALGGREALSGIPGTVGGMIYSNAGAFGMEMSDFVESARVYDVSEDKILALTNDEMKFSYRKSIFSEKEYILINARILFEKKETERILSDIKEYREKRLSTQPHEYPSLGSIFKRNKDTSAGELIDSLKLKGYSVGGAAVSEKHAGFIVNRGGATGKDFQLLIAFIKEKVLEEFGVLLEEEVEYLNSAEE